MTKVPTVDVFAQIDFKESSGATPKWSKIGIGFVVSENTIEFSLEIMPTNAVKLQIRRSLDPHTKRVGKTFVAQLNEH